MPKIKRFKNPLKSANGHASSSTIPTTQALPDASINPSHVVPQQEQPAIPPQQEQAPIPPQQETTIPQQQEQEQAPIPPQQEQAPILPATSVLGRVYSKHWKVETKDSANAIKHIYVKANEVNNLTIGERIIVDFDDYVAAYGEAQGLLAGYCGSLAIDCNLFPISFDRWSRPSGMPKKYMEDCFETILKRRFLFRANESIAFRYCNASISKKWATHRQRLWNEYFDPAKSKNEILSNVPSGINKDQWASFVAYRLKPSTIELCRRNKEIQRKQKMPHTGGSKANSRRRYEMFLKTGKTPTCGQMFIETHNKKNGSFVNDEARIIGEQIEVNMANCDNNESEISPDDMIGKMLGAEHPGRVRCMGMGAAPSNTFLNTKRRLSELNICSSSYGASSTSTYLHQKVARLESQLERTFNVLKDYIISKEGGVPEDFASLFAHEPMPAAEENGPVSPVDVRGSLADNNASHQSNA